MWVHFDLERLICTQFGSSSSFSSSTFSINSTSKSGIFPKQKNLKSSILTGHFISYYFYTDSPLSVSKVWKNESKVILSLKFQNLSLIGSLKKKSVLLRQAPEHLSFRLFLNEKEWGGRQLPITESLLRAEFFACIIFVSMQRSSFSPPALFLLQKLQLFL